MYIHWGKKERKKEKENIFLKRKHLSDWLTNIWIQVSPRFPKSQL